VLPTENGIDDNGDSASSEDELMCVDIASAMSNSTTRHRTIRLHGRVRQQEVLILVDSGSRASFVDANLVSRLRLEPQACTPSRFVAANGDTMVSDIMIPQLTSEAQGHSFQQDMTVLPLGCYDIILGGHWLEEFSPMWVHWHQRRMRFRHHGHRIMLQGILDDGSPGRPISAQQLQGLLRRGSVSQCIRVQPVHQPDSLHSLTATSSTDTPSAVVPLLAKFQDLFRPSEELPPR
jgi:hypothetical protein